MLVIKGIVFWFVQESQLRDGKSRSQGLGAIRCGGNGIVLDIFIPPSMTLTDVANSTSTNTLQ